MQEQGSCTLVTAQMVAMKVLTQSWSQWQHISERSIGGSQCFPVIQTSAQYALLCISLSTMQHTLGISQYSNFPGHNDAFSLCCQQIACLPAASGQELCCSHLYLLGSCDACLAYSLQWSAGDMHFVQ